MRAHEGKPPDPNRYKCGQCDKILKSGNTLRAHVVKEHEKKYQCLECQVCFPCRYDLDNHLESHEDVVKYLCSHCGKGLKTHRQYDSHLRLAHNPKSVECNICHKKLRKKNLKGHINRHLNVDEFVCEICSRKFTAQSKL